MPGTTVANPANTPCATDAATLNATPISALGLVNATLGPISAKTNLTTSQVNGATVYTDATATSDVDVATINVGAGGLGSLLGLGGILGGVLPSSLTNGLTIGITTPSEAKVDYACVNNALQPTYSSTLTAITINGITVPVSTLGQTLSSLPGGIGTLLNGVISINVNQHTSTANSDTETLLQVQLLGALGGGLTIDVGTATASATQSSPCAGTTVPPCT
ncbi:MAG: hypothetical protein WAL22_07555, partial [Solirubrobacteraceae bacterium]